MMGRARLAPQQLAPDPRQRKFMLCPTYPTRRKGNPTMTSDDKGQTVAMSAAQMLDQLNVYGGDAGSDFNDSDEVLGWFGWSVEGDVLRVTFTPQDDDGSADKDARVIRSWRLVEITGKEGIEPPEPWASVRPGDPHPMDANLPGVRECAQAFDEEGLQGVHGWYCSRDEHADPLHVATTGPDGYVCATYNATTHEYRRRDGR